MMKIQKMIVLAVAAASFVMATAGCSYFSEDETASKFLQKGMNGGKGGGLDGSGNADLAGGGFGNGNGLDGMNAPGSYKSGSGVGNYDGFGTPIPGVEFQPVYFKFDQSSVAPEEFSKIDAVVKYLKSNPRAGVVIEGNCDTRGTDEYNRALGERRALAAQEMMISAGITQDRIKTLSYGKEKPAVAGESEDIHAQNRRDNFVAVTLAR